MPPVSPFLYIGSLSSLCQLLLYNTISKILHLCHLGVTKSACPTAAEKCLSTAICPYSRWRSQPLFRVSRKQRYNTLDFAEQNRVPRWTLSPLDTPAKGNAVSLWIPYANRDALALLDDPEPKGGRCPPLETSRIFCVREYPNCKITVGIPCLENKKGQNLIPRIG